MKSHGAGSKLIPANQPCGYILKVLMSYDLSIKQEAIVQ